MHRICSWNCACLKIMDKYFTCLAVKSNKGLLRDTDRSYYSVSIAAVVGRLCFRSDLYGGDSFSYLSWYFSYLNDWECAQWNADTRAWYLELASNSEVVALCRNKEIFSSVSCTLKSFCINDMQDRVYLWSTLSERSCGYLSNLSLGVYSFTTEADERPYVIPQIGRTPSWCSTQSWGTRRAQKRITVRYVTNVRMIMIFFY